MKSFRDIQVDESNILTWQGLIVPVSMTTHVYSHNFCCVVSSEDFVYVPIFRITHHIIKVPFGLR